MKTYTQEQFDITLIKQKVSELAKLNQDLALEIRHLRFYFNLGMIIPMVVFVIFLIAWITLGK